MNGDLVNNPASVNTSPEGDAWFVKLDVSNAAAEAKQLLDASAYKKHCDDAANHH